MPLYVESRNEHGEAEYIDLDTGTRLFPKGDGSVMLPSALGGWTTIPAPAGRKVMEFVKEHLIFVPAKFPIEKDAKIPLLN